MNYETEKRRIADHFANRLASAEDEHRAVDSSARSHEKRFRKMSEIGNLHGKSVLDVGCALGSFHGFLQANGIESDYTGYDITEAMIVGARERHPHMRDRFQTIDILDGPTPEPAFDYVISVSPLNLPMSGDGNISTTVRLVERMFALCRIGAGICMTSAWTQRPGPETFYYDPADMVRRLGAISPNLRFDHSYLPHDFAVFCYKASLYDA